jgi:SRSO17 transposase
MLCICDRTVKIQETPPLGALAADPAQPAEGRGVRLYIVFAPAETTLAALARVAGRRWVPGLDPGIEECFEASKQEVRLGDYEIRSGHGWYCHITPGFRP